MSDLRRQKPRGRKPTPSKPPVAADEGPSLERLQKVLAAAGHGSRRDCEELIAEGRVEVDGQIVTELGTKVDPEQQTIRVDGMALRQPKLLHYVVHKPQGVVCTNDDPAGRMRVIDMVPAHGERLYTVGRLDMSSEGLIIVTNDGDLANLLTHPRYGVEKTYHVEVAGAMQKEDLEQLRKGMYLAEGFAKVVHVRIKSQFKQSTLLEIVLDEGRNREIRRLLARIEHKVLRLRRVALGPLRLGELPVGHYRQLMRDEIRKLRDAAQPRSKPRRRAGGKIGAKPQAKAKREDSRPRQPTIIGGDASPRPSGTPRAKGRKPSRPRSGRRPS